MTDIAITSAVRSNLNALQSASSLISGVQEKLATGKKVNSALDNPNSFFTAKGLENRANDLATLLDDQGQSIQTLKAADKGIGAIGELVDAAKAKANQALQTSSISEREQFSKEYNELLTQIEDIAKDSSYKGKNLLGGTGNDLNVTFNEDGSSDLDISAVDYTDTSNAKGLNLSDLNSSTGGTNSISLNNDGATGDPALTGSQLVTLDDAFSAGDTLTITNTAGEETTFTITETTTVTELNTAISNSSTDTSSSVGSGAINITSSDNAVQIKSDNSAFNGGNTLQVGTLGSFGSDSDIESTLSSLKSAQDTLRAQASTFGTNLSIVQNREDFTKALINTLEEGAGKLTLADTNQEGANLLALQTQQQLASTSLSLASQASQNVLRLIG
ncbi:flagellin [Roseibium sp. TrichSKD4]|uniref:flagellin N-terminal helical domain-containing protein n=1 Tax=Roseibium sp. TrichSKD4 TaxID=744980 RepID=UPI0001E57433|nr:flagellin [Roseibium sp. TrichSKD4]EFO30773.1 flagellin [Roseibium sp. TrichSKD4]